MNRLAAGRLLWLVVAVPASVLSLSGIPSRFVALQHVCGGGSCGQFGAPPTQQMAHTLYTFGLSLQQYAGYTMGIEVITALSYCALGTLLFWRARTTGTLFVAAMLVAFGALSTNLPDAAAAAHPLMRTPVALLDALALASLTIFLYVFPDGRFVPGWTRPLAVVTAAGYAAVFLYPDGVLQPIRNPVSLLGEVLLLLLGVGAQLYRYRTVSGPTERQQTKWVVFGIAVGLTTNVAVLFVAGAWPSTNPLIIMAEDTVFSVAGVIMPATIAIAVLHYRLYDIDTLANRTLVYGSLTVSLAALYIGCVIGLEAVSSGIIGQHSDLAIAVATLAVAALFNPWRRRLQVFIDRRFYRRKYDAARILAAFSTRVRDDVDLSRLESDILAVVMDTMQPVRASLWLPREDAP